MDNGCPYSSAASNRSQAFIAGMELGYVARLRGYFLCRAVYGGQDKAVFSKAATGAVKLLPGDGHVGKSPSH